MVPLEFGENEALLGDTVLLDLTILLCVLLWWCPPFPAHISLLPWQREKVLPGKELPLLSGPGKYFANF